MNFFTEEIFLTELNFLKGDTNIYFKQTTCFEKERFFENHVFLKNIFFFNVVLLHLNNHIRLPLWNLNVRRDREISLIWLLLVCVLKDEKITSPH